MWTRYGCNGTKNYAKEKKAKVRGVAAAVLLLSNTAVALSPNPFDSDAMLAGILGTEYIDRHVESNEDNQKIVEACGYSKYYVRAKAETADVFLIKKSMAKKYRVEKSVGQIKRIEQIAFDKQDDALLSLVIDVREPPTQKVKEVRLVFENEPLSIKQRPWNVAFRIVAQAVKDNYSFSFLRTKEKYRDKASAYVMEWQKRNPEKMQTYYENSKERRREYMRQYAFRKSQELTPEEAEKVKDYKKKMWHLKYKGRYGKKGSAEREENKKSLIHDVVFLNREENGGGIDVADKMETPAQQIETDEIYRMVWDAIKTLDPISREIATLILGSVKDENIANAIPCEIDLVRDVRVFLMNKVNELGLEE